MISILKAISVIEESLLWFEFKCFDFYIII